MSPSAPRPERARADEARWSCRERNRLPHVRGWASDRLASYPRLSCEPRRRARRKLCRFVSPLCSAWSPTSSGDIVPLRVVQRQRHVGHGVVHLASPTRRFRDLVPTNMPVCLCAGLLQKSTLWPRGFVRGLHNRQRQPVHVYQHNRRSVNVFQKKCRTFCSPEYLPGSAQHLQLSNKADRCVAETNENAICNCSRRHPGIMQTPRGD